MIYRDNKPPPLFQPPSNGTRTSNAAARGTDPSTSVDAGRIATDKHPDHNAAAIVLEMLGGMTMTDEQIVERAHRRGVPLSAQRLRCGRKHAAELGLIVEVGKVPLASGHLGRQWRKAT